MATHNPRTDLFERQIASLRAQTVEDWQCLVFDDSSTDRDEVQRRLTDPRFVFLPATDHLGAYRAFEHLLTLGDDLPTFLCDQDDTWHPAKLERMLSAPASQATFCAMRVVDPAGQPIRQRYLPRPPSAETLTPAGLLLMNVVSGAAMMVSPQVVRAALPFPAPDLRGWHDQWLAAVAARLGTVSYLHEALTDYTRHESQVTGDGLRQIDRQRLRSYTHSLRGRGLRHDLSSRAGWVRAAAQRLLEIPGPEDPDLEALARGHWAGLLSAGLRRGDVPVARAALLAAGNITRRWR